VFVNGERIEWRMLEDGDEIVVGRYRLRFLSVPAQPSGRRPAGETLPATDRPTVNGIA
jgi:hypothetical protein